MVGNVNTPESQDVQSSSQQVHVTTFGRDHSLPVISFMLPHLKEIMTYFVAPNAPFHRICETGSLVGLFTDADCQCLDAALRRALNAYGPSMSGCLR